MDTLSIVRAYIVENFLLGADHGLAPAESLLASGVLDSTGVVELTMFLEQKFGIQISDEDLVPANLDSLVSIAKFVERKRLNVASDAA